MATLKILGNGGGTNYIWLTGVRRVERLFVFPTDSQNTAPPWEMFQRALATLEDKDGASEQSRLIRFKTTEHENHCPIFQANGQPLSLLYVVLDTGDDVKCQNWLVWTEQNYLLENGKTIDRI